MEQNTNKLVNDCLNKMNKSNFATYIIVLDTKYKSYTILQTDVDLYYFNKKYINRKNMEEIIHIVKIISINIVNNGHIELIYGNIINNLFSIILEITVNKEIIIDYNLKFNENADDCSICLEPIYTDMGKNKYCRHYFHCNCIKQWINKNISSKCPLCREQLDIYGIKDIYYDASPNAFPLHKKVIMKKNKLSRQAI